MVNAIADDQRSKEVLTNCIKANDMATVIDLVGRGYPIDQPIINCGITILMHVATHCNAECTRQILTLSPDANARDSIGRTALHFACRAGNEQSF